MVLRRFEEQLGRADNTHARRTVLLPSAAGAPTRMPVPLCVNDAASARLAPPTATTAAPQQHLPRCAHSPAQQEHVVRQPSVGLLAPPPNDGSHSNERPSGYSQPYEPGQDSAILKTQEMQAAPSQLTEHPNVPNPGTRGPVAGRHRGAVSAGPRRSGPAVSLPPRQPAHGIRNRRSLEQSELSKPAIERRSAVRDPGSRKVGEAPKGEAFWNASTEEFQRWNHQRARLPQRRRR